MASNEPVSARAMVASAAERGTGKTSGSRVMSKASAGRDASGGSKPSARKASSTLGKVSGRSAPGRCPMKRLATPRNASGDSFARSSRIRRKA